MLANKKEKANPLAKMPKEHYGKLLELLAIQSSQMNEKFIWKYLCDWLDSKSIKHRTDNAGNILVTKGNADIYPCVCSHMDTVHDIHDDFALFYEECELDKNLILSAMSGDKQVGIGGDDKCGIFVCMYILEKFENIKCVFFTQEEGGCKGAGAIDRKFFDNVGYLIEPDRWGAHDFICINGGNNTVSDEYLTVVEPVLKTFKYEKTSGLITDSISLYGKKIGISCVNVSCGYYSHHSDSEVIDVNELWHSTLFVEKLIQTLGDKRYESLPPKPKTGFKYGWYGYNNGVYQRDYSGGIYGDDHYGYYDREYGWWNSRPKNETPIIETRDTSIKKVGDAIDYKSYCYDSLNAALRECGLDWVDLWELSVDSDEAKELSDTYLTYTNENLFESKPSIITPSRGIYSVYDFMVTPVNWNALTSSIRKAGWVLTDFDKVSPSDIGSSLKLHEIAKEYKKQSFKRLFVSKSKIKKMLKHI